MRAARPHSLPPSRNKGAHAPSHADAHERDGEGNSTACPAGRKANQSLPPRCVQRARERYPHEGTEILTRFIITLNHVIESSLDLGIISRPLAHCQTRKA